MQLLEQVKRTEYMSQESNIRLLLGDLLQGPLPSFSRYQYHPIKLVLTEACFSVLVSGVNEAIQGNVFP